MLVDGGSERHRKNAVIRGYKVGILARRSPDLHLTHNDLSYNWKPRLYSGIEKESLVDWMSYHQNEKDEWLRYGAGDLLSRLRSRRRSIAQPRRPGPERPDGRPTRRGLKIWNNTFQFLSAIGVGLYRVTDSTIMHNRIDWCVRGYSHGFYNRGQDSAGLLMYEQSEPQHRRLQLDHARRRRALPLGGPDRRWTRARAAQTTICFYENDFSHAPTNGIEATFSRNKFIEQPSRGVLARRLGRLQLRLDVVIGNRFARNTEGHRDRARPGQPDPWQYVFDGDETAHSALAESHAGSRTGGIRSTETREATTTHPRERHPGQSRSAIDHPRYRAASGCSETRSTETWPSGL